MKVEPTKEQLDSRKELDDFLAKVRKPIQALAKIKSEWFGRPDDELKGWIERGRAIEEIKDSLGYKLIMAQTDKEMEWATKQMRICPIGEVEKFRSYLNCLEFLHDFILTTDKNADMASSVLSGREAAIGRESHAFVKNARVEGN